MTVKVYPDHSDWPTEFKQRLIPLAPALPTFVTNGPLEPVFSLPLTRCLSRRKQRHKPFQTILPCVAICNVLR